MSVALGDRVRLARINLGLSQRKAASRIGVSNGWLAKVELGEYRPAEKMMEQLADALGLPFDELMCLAGRVPQDVQEFITSDPSVLAFLRDAMEASRAQRAEKKEKEL